MKKEAAINLVLLFLQSVAQLREIYDPGARDAMVSDIHNRFANGEMLENVARDALMARVQEKDRDGPEDAA